MYSPGSRPKSKTRNKWNCPGTFSEQRTSLEVTENGNNFPRPVVFTSTIVLVFQHLVKYLDQRQVDAALPLRLHRPLVPLLDLGHPFRLRQFFERPTLVPGIALPGLELAKVLRDEGLQAALERDLEMVSNTTPLLFVRV